MPIPESLKTKYSLSGDRYIAENADRAISDLVACISRMHAENTALTAKMQAAEQRADELSVKAKTLEDENARLDISVHELTSANRRLTAEAERLDKKLAEVSVAVTANDKKLSDAAERLTLLTERAEQLFADLVERSDDICREFDRRVALMAAPESPSVSSLASDDAENANETEKMPEPSPEAGITTTDIAVDAEPVAEAVSQPVSETETTAATDDDETPDELLELDGLTEDDKLTEADDPNLFEDAGDAAVTAEVTAKTAAAEDESTATDFAATSVEVDDGDMLRALKKAIGMAVSAEPELHTDKDTSGKVTYADTVTAAEDESNSKVEAPSPSPTDDDIKSMLAAMYSDNEPSPTAVGNQTTDSKAGEGDGDKGSDFGSVKSTLDAIRRKIGNKSGENRK